MTADRHPGRVVVAWWPTSDTDHAALVGLVGEVAGTSPQRMRLRHACRSCGSDGHGKPHVVVAGGGGPAVHVSLSRSGGMTLAAVTGVGPVGVDVEAVAGHGGDLTPWVRAESLVKATGHGLTIDPQRLQDVPHRTIDLSAPDDYVAAVTVLTDAPVQVVTR